jgi:Pyridoxamine 5'-phosphate oxidase
MVARGVSIEEGPMDPVAELLDLPDGYGRPRKKLRWATVRAELEQAKQYWLASVRPDGRPHVVPLDGIWLDDVWFYGGSPASVHHRTVRAHKEAVMHLADPMRVVIVEGEVRRANPSPEVARRLAEASSEKYKEYGYANDPNAYADALGLFPRRVIAWLNYPTDATRFLFSAA